jgi:hypothetical protein
MDNPLMDDMLFKLETPKHFNNNPPLTNENEHRTLETTDASSESQKFVVLSAQLTETSTSSRPAVEEHSRVGKEVQNPRTQKMPLELPSGRRDRSVSSRAIYILSLLLCLPSCY